MWSVREYKEDARFMAATDRGTRRKRALEICTEKLKAASTKFEKSEKDRGDKILQEMEEAVVDNTGNFLTRLFKILRRAVQGSAGTQQLAAVYGKGDREGEVVSGPAVRAEVAKQARALNARKEVDVEAVRDVLEFLRPSRPGRERMNVADELCGWEACQGAIRKCKKGKGMGLDGFDGYLVRLMPMWMQRRYHEILQGARTRKWSGLWHRRAWARCSSCRTAERGCGGSKQRVMRVPWPGRGLWGALHAVQCAGIGASGMLAHRRKCATSGTCLLVHARRRPTTREEK